MKKEINLPSGLVGKVQDDKVLSVYFTLDGKITKEDLEKERITCIEEVKKDFPNISIPEDSFVAVDMQDIKHTYIANGEYYAHEYDAYIQATAIKLEFENLSVYYINAHDKENYCVLDGFWSEVYGSTIENGCGDTFTPTEKFKKIQ